MSSLYCSYKIDSFPNIYIPIECARDNDNSSLAQARHKTSLKVTSLPKDPSFWGQSISINSRTKKYRV